MKANKWQFRKDFYARHWHFITVGSQCSTTADAEPCSDIKCIWLKELKRDAV